jgi:serine/threonine protein kinase
MNAVYCCHTNNIVHCDIKPDNFLISNEDVFLCDFVHAQVERSDEPMLYGTTEYWSPEVCEDLPTANDFPRDMWALGVTILELVYHQYPFSTEIRPDYIGGNLDRARAEALTTSIQKFFTKSMYFVKFFLIS